MMKTCALRGILQAPTVANSDCREFCPRGCGNLGPPSSQNGAVSSGVNAAPGSSSEHFPGHIIHTDARRALWRSKRHVCESGGMLGYNSIGCPRLDRQPRGRAHACARHTRAPHHGGAVPLHRRQYKEELSLVPPGRRGDDAQVI